jgi:hypothetical protein
MRLTEGRKAREEDKNDAVRHEFHESARKIQQGKDGRFSNTNEREFFKQERTELTEGGNEG